MTTQSIGQRGETLAVSYLTKKGYAIEETNYRAERGEIDIIARDRETLVFIEVKTARNQTFGPPETWVDVRKQRQIGKVAAAYLTASGNPDQLCRFDVLGIDLSNASKRVRHIENAFWL